MSDTAATNTQIGRRADGTVRLVLTSDSHERHSDLIVPDGDIFIFAGDVGDGEDVIFDFDQWLARMPHPIKLIVPGNHDYSLLGHSGRNLITNANLLIEESINVLGLKIWGSPITPLRDGAFGVGAEQDRERLFSFIPRDTDVVITHSPPYGILDQPSPAREHLGCRALLNAVVRVQPTLHAFGHVHGAYGTTTFGDTFFANASLVDADHKLKNSPIVIDIVMPEPVPPVPQSYQPICSSPGRSARTQGKC